jgi:hypothetical protein
LAVLFAALAGAAVVTGVRAMPGPRPGPREPATYTIFPISGELINAEDAACAPFLPDLVQRPNWELQVDHRSSSCTGTGELGRYLISADGTLTTNEPGLVERTLFLTADELARVRALGALSCARREAVGYGEVYFMLTIGPGDGTGGARIPAASTAGDELGAIIDGALDRYAEELVARRAVSLELYARSEELSDVWTRRSAMHAHYLDASGTVTVRHRGKVVARVQLPARTIADIVDTGAAAWDDPRGESPEGDDFALARGRLRVDRAARDIVIPAWTASAGARHLADLVHAHALRE